MRAIIAAKGLGIPGRQEALTNVRASRFYGNIVNPQSDVFPLYDTLSWMAQSKEDDKFEQLVQRIDHRSKLLRTWELKAGVSAQVTALEIDRPDGLTQRLVVRRHGDADLKQNPNIASDEFRLLQILRAAGVAAPTPCYLDQSGEIFPRPYVVLEYIEGEPEFAPTNLPDFLLQLAAHLSRVHAVDCSNLDLAFLPEQEKMCAERLRERPAKMDEELGEGRIRAALEAVWPLPQRNRPVLLHGDFWPGNALWKDGQLVAVIDWEDAQIGDPLADLANSRLEILWAFGIEAMHSFTHNYASQATIDFTDLPYWDLCAALRHASKSDEWATYVTNEETMRRGYSLFIAHAFEKISVLENR
jgi:aminoglycoside phosphotransferase (APT) family kinase protein